jgi:hypothetical protein
MRHQEKEILNKFVKSIISLGININSQFSTRDHDYDIITYVDEVQVLDNEEKVIISIYKDDVKNE